MGATFRQRTVTVTDLPGTVRALRESGKRVLCATLDESAANLLDVKADAGTCFVIGNESNGIRPETVSASDGTVIIPMLPGAESLNASAAATVLLWEQFKATR